MTSRTEQIWKTFGKHLKAYIGKKITDSTAAEDILQDVFLKIHSKIDTLKERANVRAWVYTVTRNTVIDYYRKRKIKLKDMDSVAAAAESDHDSAAGEIAAGLKDMVELARKLGISVSEAKSRVQRARNMLKDSLMRCCHFQFDRFGTIIDFHPLTCCCCRQAS